MMNPVFRKIKNQIIPSIKHRLIAKNFRYETDFVSGKSKKVKKRKPIKEIKNPIGVTLDKNDTYFSVVIPYYMRLHYLSKLINSIHEYADMPFEIIIHADGSPDGSDVKMYENFRDRVSTIIINTNIGGNTGLAVSANRAIKLATSKYILFINADCKIIKPCFKDLKNILDKRYVGYVCPADKYKNCTLSNKGTPFSIVPGIGGGACIAFRKAFWEEIGGFEEDIQSGSADTPLFYKSWLNGYFKANSCNGPYIVNMSKEEESNKDSTIRGGRMHFPKIFGIERIEYEKACSDRSHFCKNKESNERNKDCGVSNIDYHDKYSHTIFSNGNDLLGMDWVKARLHGQNRWEEQILEDYNAVK